MNRGMHSGAKRSLAVVLGLFALGCEDLGEFRTGPDEVFRGQVVGGDRDGGVSFIRQGFAPHTQMELTFDPARASAARGRSSPGTLVTYRCRAAEAPCAEDAREPGHFRRAALEPIANLSNDELSQYDFPGGSRLRNYIFGARFRTPDDPAERLRDAMVFVSLLENGRIEVRVIAQSLLDNDGEQLYEPLFGVFRLERQER